jgi:NAD-dependent dihydropyrimidine dehydrogenase PreA subunit
MSVQRYDLNACIGCRNCNCICPMDVFRFDETAMKSVIAYPENCQSCGQCYVNCPGRSLVISNFMTGYSITSHRATTTAYNARAV